MGNTWGSPQKNKSWTNYKVIALWLFLIGAVIYLLFPNILSFLAGQNTNAATTLGDVVLPDSSADTANGTDGLTLPSVFEGLYQDSEISTGYWIMYVDEDELKQLQLTAEGYDFVMSVLNKDNSTQEIQGELPLLVATNGQITKYLVSDQFFVIIQSLADIAGRAGSI